MKTHWLFTLAILLCCHISTAQKVKDYFYAERDTKELPVLVRGDLAKKTILLFVQGGPGEAAIDFGRSDYPRWKKTLEKEVAIAYYDQRGLNRKVKKIDSAKINYDQYSRDLILIAKKLKEKYNARIFLMGHSYGGGYVYHCLAQHRETDQLIEGGIILNSPLTSDYTPIRYAYYRPLYLKNLASEFVNKGIEKEKWQEAYDWIQEIDSITTRKQVIRWNTYVNSAFEPTERKATIGMAFRVVFSRPYNNPFKYLNFKDNDVVSDLIRADQKKGIDFFSLLPKIENRVLVLSGRFDDIAIPEEMQKAHELLNNSVLKILPEAGHQSFLDQPELFNQAILEFALNH